MSGPEVQVGAPVTGLSHVQLLVSDVAASAAWYRTALGLESFAADEAKGFVALRHPGSGVVVVLTALGGPAGAGQRLDHLAFAVPDAEALAAWADHLTGAGIEHPGLVLERGNHSLQLRDPDGVAIELVAPGAPA